MGPWFAPDGIVQQVVTALIDMGITYSQMLTSSEEPSDSDLQENSAAGDCGDYSSRTGKIHHAING